MSMFERAADVAHKLVATTLIGISLGGLTFMGFAGYDTIARYYQRKAIAEQQAAAGEKQ